MCTSKAGDLEHQATGTSELLTNSQGIAELHAEDSGSAHMRLYHGVTPTVSLEALLCIWRLAPTLKAALTAGLPRHLKKSGPILLSW